MAPARLHLYVARTDQERRQVLAAIGPYWDGNEVWLLATGGALFVAFPPVLASGLSGFYFAIFLVLWWLILRGISIEFRSHVEHPLWRAAWDFVFFAGSAVLPVLFGAALGNLAAGPSDRRATADFALALFTDFTRETTGRHSRLVHDPGRRLRLCWRSPVTVRRFWPGRPMARCMREAAGPRCGSTPRSPSCGRPRRG